MYVLVASLKLEALPPVVHVNWRLVLKGLLDSVSLFHKEESQEAHIVLTLREVKIDQQIQVVSARFLHCKLLHKLFFSREGPRFQEDPELNSPQITTIYRATVSTT